MTYEKVKTKVLFITLLAVLTLIIAACGAAQPAARPAEKVVETVEVVKTVEVEKEVVKEVVVTATPEPEAKAIEIFHWWTGPGEKEAADAMFKALNDKYPDIEVIQNPVAGGGGVSHRVVLQGRIAAGLPPDTFQTLGGAELKAYVDGGAPLSPWTICGPNSGAFSESR